MNFEVFEDDPVEDQFDPFAPGFESFLGAKLDGAETKSEEKTLERTESGRVPKESAATRAAYMQETMINLTPLFISSLPQQAGENQNDYIRRVKEEVKQYRDTLQAERNAGLFGPASKQAYRAMVEWLEQRAVLDVVRLVDSYQIPMPPGCPISLTLDEFGRAIDPELYKSIASSQNLRANLNLDTSVIPSEADIQRFEAAVRWCEIGNDAVKLARARHDTVTLNRLIGDLNMPSWQLKEGESADSWRTSAFAMVDLAAKMRNYIEAMHSLFKISTHNDFPFNLPPGTTLTIEEGGKLHQVTDKDVSLNASILKNGVIKQIKLDLPKDLRQDHPANAQRIDSLKRWLGANAERIEKSVDRLADLDENPLAAIMYGDVEIRNGKGIFNEQGQFKGISKADYVPEAGEELKDVNLIGFNFEAEAITDGPHKGKYRVKQTVTAEHAPWFAYQNYRFLGVKLVGSMIIEEKIVDGETFMPIKRGDTVEIVKAKHLAGHKRGQQFAYHGERLLVSAMDAAMITTGTIEIAGAVRGAKLAAAGRTTGLELSGGQTAWQVSKGTMRFTIGGLGVLNGAGGREAKIGNWHAGEDINLGRGIYFLGDISLGLARGGWNYFRSGGVARPLSSSDKVHLLIHGRATPGAEKLEGMAWVRHVHTASMYTFKACEFGFAPVIAGELRSQVGRIQDAGKRDPVADAKLQLGKTRIGDGRGMQAAKPGDFAFDNKQALDGALGVLDNFSTTLRDGRSPESAEQIKQIFDECAKLLSSNTHGEERRRFKQVLLHQMSFTGEEIIELELAHPASKQDANFRLTEQQLHDLLDPSSCRNLPRAVQDLAGRILAGRDKDVQAACAIALFYLCRDQDGKLPTHLAEAKTVVPRYKRTVITYESTPEGEVAKQTDVVVEARELSSSLTPDDAVAILKRDLAAGKLGNRGIATGDMLCRIGAITHQQYATILQDVLTDSSASRGDKFRALSDAFGARFATILDGVRQQEKVLSGDLTFSEREEEAGRHFKVSSKDLFVTLENVARTDKDADVRALAALQLYGLKESDPRRRQDILSAVHGLLKQCASLSPGELAKQVKAYLRDEMAAPVSSVIAELADWLRQRKLDAALTFALISHPADMESQREMNQAIAESLSNTDLRLTVRVIEALLPDRIKQLSVDDPRTAYRLRAAIVDLLKCPVGLADEPQLVAILKNVNALFANADKESKVLLAMRLERLLRRDDIEYVQYYPLMRAAAIESLSQLGSRSEETVNLIRSHATAAPVLQIGKISLVAGEQDGLVRAAAVKALDFLKDVELSSYIGALINTETDPHIAARLRDVRFENQRIERDSEEYKKQYEAILTRLSDAAKEEKYPHLKSFGEQEAANWLNERYPLLQVKVFEAALNKEIDDASSYGGKLVNLSGSLFLDELEALKKVQETRMGYWKNLELLATGKGLEADKARKALYYLVVSDHPYFRTIYSGADLIEIQSDCNKSRKHRLFDIEPKSQAARILQKCCSAELSSGRDLVAGRVEEILTTRLGGIATDSVGSDLLAGLKELARPDASGNVAISRERLASIYAVILKHEVGAEGGFAGKSLKDQSPWLQLYLIRELAAMKNRMMYPALEAIAKRKVNIEDPNLRREFEEVAKVAQETLEELRDSVPLIWHATAIDFVSSAEDRATRLGTALTNRTSADQLIQQMFSAYKGHSFKINDPAFGSLSVAMGDTNERVRMAAAMLVMESNIPNTHPCKVQAVKTLALLMRCGACKDFQKEAFQGLSRFTLTKPLLLILPKGESLRIEKQAGPEEVAEVLYNRLFSRTADPDSSWAVSMFKGGAKYGDVVKAAINDSLGEFKKSIPRNKADVVPFLYLRLLGRNYTPGEDKDRWGQLLEKEGIDAVINGIIETEEFKAKAPSCHLGATEFKFTHYTSPASVQIFTDPQSVVEILYGTVLGRQPDKGSGGFADMIKAGIPYPDVVRSVINNELREFRSTVPARQDQVVAFLYKRLLNRQVSPEEQVHWNSVLGKDGLDAVINGILYSSEFTLKSPLYCVGVNEMIFTDGGKPQQVINGEVLRLQQIQKWSYSGGRVTSNATSKFFERSKR
ncbi:MAG: hypothetical protein K2W95_09350 [Candidatus Obscuribacterales bacterium]|nr:hypothetical protein [Candidatus Obscuribacterales bacterium]